MQLTDEEQQRLPEKRSELRQRCTQFRYHLSTAAIEIENQGGGDLAPDRAQHLSSLAGALHSILGWFSDNYDDLRQISHAVINGWTPTLNEFRRDIEPILEGILKTLKPSVPTRDAIPDPVTPKELADAWGFRDVDYLARKLRDAAGMKPLKRGERGRKFNHSTLDRITPMLGGRIAECARASGFGKPDSA